MTRIMLFVLLFASNVTPSGGFAVNHTPATGQKVPEWDTMQYGLSPQQLRVLQQYTQTLSLSELRMRADFPDSQWQRRDSSSRDEEDLLPFLKRWLWRQCKWLSREFWRLGSRTIGVLSRFTASICAYEAMVGRAAIMCLSAIKDYTIMIVTWGCVSLARLVAYLGTFPLTLYWGSKALLSLLICSQRHALTNWWFTIWSKRCPRRAPHIVARRRHLCKVWLHAFATLALAAVLLAGCHYYVAPHCGAYRVWAENTALAVLSAVLAVYLTWWQPRLVPAWSLREHVKNGQVFLENGKHYAKQGKAFVPVDIVYENLRPADIAMPESESITVFTAESLRAVPKPEKALDTAAITAAVSAALRQQAPTPAPPPSTPPKEELAEAIATAVASALDAIVPKLVTPNAALVEAMRQSSTIGQYPLADYSAESYRPDTLFTKGSLNDNSIVIWTYGSVIPNGPVGWHESFRLDVWKVNGQTVATTVNHGWAGIYDVPVECLGVTTKQFGAIRYWQNVTKTGRHPVKDLAPGSPWKHSEFGDQTAVPSDPEANELFWRKHLNGPGWQPHHTDVSVCLTDFNYSALGVQQKKLVPERSFHKPGRLYVTNPRDPTMTGNAFGALAENKRAAEHGICFSSVPSAPSCSGAAIVTSGNTYLAMVAGGSDKACADNVVHCNVGYTGMAVYRACERMTGGHWYPSHIQGMSLQGLEQPPDYSAFKGMSEADCDELSVVLRGQKPVLLSGETDGYIMAPDYIPASFTGYGLFTAESGGLARHSNYVAAAMKIAFNKLKRRGMGKSKQAVYLAIYRRLNDSIPEFDDSGLFADESEEDDFWGEVDDDIRNNIYGDSCAFVTGEVEVPVAAVEKMRSETVLETTAVKDGCEDSHDGAQSHYDVVAHTATISALHLEASRGASSGGAVAKKLPRLVNAKLPKPGEVLEKSDSTHALCGSPRKAVRLDHSPRASLSEAALARHAARRAMQVPVTVKDYGYHFCHTCRTCTDIPDLTHPGIGCTIFLCSGCQEPVDTKRTREWAKDNCLYTRRAALRRQHVGRKPPGLEDVVDSGEPPKLERERELRFQIAHSGPTEKQLRDKVYQASLVGPTVDELVTQVSLADRAFTATAIKRCVNTMLTTGALVAQEAPSGEVRVRPHVAAQSTGSLIDFPPSFINALQLNERGELDYNEYVSKATPMPVASPEVCARFDLEVKPLLRLDGTLREWLDQVSRVTPLTASVQGSELFRRYVLPDAQCDFGPRDGPEMEHCRRIGRVRASTRSRPVLDPEPTDLMRAWNLVDADGTCKGVLPPRGPLAELTSLEKQLRRKRARQRGYDLNHVVEYVKGGVPGLWGDELDKPVRSYVAGITRRLDPSKGTGWSSRAFACHTNEQWRADPNSIRAGVITVVLEMITDHAVVAASTPESLFRAGLIVPEETSVKDEVHKRSKARDERWRLIWMTATRASFRDRFFHDIQNKTEIKAYQADLGLSDLFPTFGACAGMGHDDVSIQQTCANIRKLLAGGRKAISIDAKGWDMSVTRTLWMVDAVRRCILAHSQGMPEIFLMGILNTGLSLSAHVLRCGCDVIEVLIFGIMGSGISSTTSSNCPMRALIHSLAFWILNGHLGLTMTNGDDCIGRDTITAAHMAIWEELGMELDEAENTRDLEMDEELPFTSHGYNVMAGTAIYRNEEKLLLRLAICDATKVSLTAEQMAGVLVCLRHTPATREKVLDFVRSRHPEWRFVDWDQMVPDTSLL